VNALVDVVLEQVGKDYGRVRALADINLHIRPGMFGLLGPNGAGKTTLLRILATVLPPTRGRVRVGPYDLRTQPDAIRRLLGYVPQDFGLPGRFTAAECLDYFACLKGIGDARTRRRLVEELLVTVNLDGVAGRRVGGFSGGMRRRLGIAQALLNDPLLLVVDEPTAGLDPEERLRFRDLLTRLAARRVVILSTHIVADVEETCDQLAVLYGGRIAFSGAPEALVDEYRDRVWELEVEGGEVHDPERLGLPCPVLTTRRRGAAVRVRVLADQPPHPAAEPVEPSLEDAYLARIADRRALGRGDAA